MQKKLSIKYAKWSNKLPQKKNNREDSANLVDG